ELVKRIAQTLCEEAPAAAVEIEMLPVARVEDLAPVLVSPPVPAPEQPAVPQWQSSPSKASSKASVKVRTQARTAYMLIAAGSLLVAAAIGFTLLRGQWKLRPSPATPPPTTSAQPVVPQAATPEAQATVPSGSVAIPVETPAEAVVTKPKAIARSAEA